MSGCGRRRGRRASGGDWQNAGTGRSRRSRKDGAWDGADDMFGFAAMGEQMAEDFSQMGERMWRDQRAMHLRQQRKARDARRAARQARRDARRQARSCDGGGAWAYWWLIFPLMFWVLPAMGRGFDRMVGRAESGFDAALRLSPLTPVAELMSAALGIGFGPAYLLVLAALVVNGAALIWALRAGGAPGRA